MDFSQTSVGSDIIVKLSFVPNPTISSFTKPETPIITPSESEFMNANVITIEGTEGDIIYYTINGNSPTILSNRYNGSFVINSSTIIKAVSFKEIANQYSDVLTRNFVKQQPVI